MEQIFNYFQIILFEGNKGNLQIPFIGIIGSLIAILFSILITIVVSSSNKYPSNFIRKLSEDPRTRNFYIFLVSAIIFQILLYYLNISSLILDILYIIVVFYYLFKYWKYILSFLDPLKVIEEMSDEELSKNKITELGDYVKIGLEDKNHELTSKAIGKLSKLNERLKNG